MQKVLCNSLIVFMVMIGLYASSASANVPTTKFPLFLNVFIHDDIPHAARANLRRDYFAWLLKDLESITGRRIYLELIENYPPLTNFKYKGDNHDASVKAWAEHATGYANSKNLPWSPRTKYLLLTNSKLNSATVGAALPRQHAGIASLETYIAPAHELGHMFGATHENAETLLTKGWPCGTNMSAKSNPSRLKANCYLFSDANREAIRAYLSQTP